MITTVTFNPSIDYIMDIPTLTVGDVNRSAKEVWQIGGKGLNVSRILWELGEESVALGFVAGFTGKHIEDTLHQLGVRTDFIRLPEGNSRINVKIHGTEETQLNGAGPYVPQAMIDTLLEKLSGLSRGDVVVLAGNIPTGVPRDIYETILKTYDRRGVEFVVDATGELLLNCLSYHPFLIKPNQYELAEIGGKSPDSEDAILEMARECQEKGARNVLVSLGKEGALLLDEDGGVHRSKAPAGKPVHTVGAGDSMVAGFISGFLKNGDWDEALRWGIASGSATAFSPELAKYEEIEALYTRLIP